MVKSNIVFVKKRQLFFALLVTLKPLCSNASNISLLASTCLFDCDKRSTQYFTELRDKNSTNPRFESTSF